MKVDTRKSVGEIKRRRLKLPSLNIRTKLIGGFLLILALLIGVSVFSYFGFNTLVSSRRAIFILSGIAILITGCLAFFISRLILFRIKNLSRALKKMANGDLTEVLKVKSYDEIGIMARSYNEMQKYLIHLVMQLKQNAGQLSSASDQLAASTGQSVANNTNQAAQGAKQAAEYAGVVSDAKLTLSGMDKVKSDVAAMFKRFEELGDRSAEIGEIAAVIDDIAAQTNLLALNAAIEATRAGDQGRGFAAVSDEVRKLAERTATATKEIAELVSSIQKGTNEASQTMIEEKTEVDKGYNMCVQTGQSLDQILKASVDVNSQIGQISAKAHQVDNDNILASSQILKNIAASLQESVAMFKVNDNSGEKVHLDKQEKTSK